MYLVGEALEGALLSIGATHETLFAEPPDPSAALWTGPQPTLDELADRLKLEVRPIAEFEGAPGSACAPPVDALTTWWLSDLLDRPLEPAYGEPQSPEDALLAEALIELRSRHDAAALAQLRWAATVTVEAHCSGMRATSVGAREYQVCAAMQQVIARHGMAQAYQPIVTVHGEVLHNESHAQVLQNGDLLLADVGAETPEGWAADVTRTWPVNGRFSTPQRDLYEVVLNAQQRAIDTVRPNVRYLEVHLCAQRALASGLADLGILRGSVDDLVEAGAVAVFFPHGVGHLLGLDVHDMEDLGDRAGYPTGRGRQSAPGTRYLRLDRDLLPGMLVTIEPGFYQIAGLLAEASRDRVLAKLIDFDRLAKFADVRGIRIEDDVLVTDDGAEVLTSAAPKSVDLLEAHCQAAR